MDIVQLYNDYSVDYKTEGHKHCRPGWVNTPCPFCEGNTGYHLGFEISTEHYICWRCGWHPILPTIARLINLGERETYAIVKSYGVLIPKQSKKPQVDTKEYRLPSGTSPLLEHHKQYLISRNYDPDQLVREWNLLSTGPVSLLDGINYNHRIFIPFIWNGQEVSFDTRDVTGKDPNRYKACPLERELIPHKEILYGKQEYWGQNTICVEGPTDAWRFGANSFAVSGIKFTPAQVRVISKTFKRVAVVFDDDPQAILQANKLVAELKFRGVDAFRVDIEGDPGSMEQEEANYLVKQLVEYKMNYQMKY